MKRKQQQQTKEKLWVRPRAECTNEGMHTWRYTTCLEHIRDNSSDNPSESWLQQELSDFPQKKDFEKESRP